MSVAPLLSVRGLEVRSGGVALVEAVELDLLKGQTHGLVGESGSGKSISAMAIMRLLDAAQFEVEAQHISFEGRELTRLDEGGMRHVRGAEISMIFQEPMTALNPVLPVGEQIAETLRVHQRLSRTAARKRALEMLDWVRIPAADRRIDEYPHQLSGGMRQRVMIAIAIACQPKLLIADEPTTALDVTIQAQILELLHDLQSELHMAILLITHDLGVVAGYADHVSVMYAGRIVETGTTEQIFDAPLHPYTEGLLRSHPPVDADLAELATIPGTVPEPHLRPEGCRFGPRCAHFREICDQADPRLMWFADHHRAACIRPRGYVVNDLLEVEHG